MRSPGPGLRRRRRAARDAAVAGGIAAIVSGAPSTAYAVARGRDPLEAALAAGTLLLPRERRRGSTHDSTDAQPIESVRCTIVAAGLAIAALDLGVVGRRFPAIRALPLAPQIADHIAYAWTVAAVLHRRRIQP